MKMRWLNYILNRRRARFFPWDVLVADAQESEADVHASDAEEKPDTRRAQSHRDRPQRVRGCGQMRCVTISKRNAWARQRVMVSRRVGARRSRDGLRPNRVD